MSNYTKTTDFAAKDALITGDPAKVVKGTEIETEFDNISTAIATKADEASPTFTGTVTVPTPFTVGSTSVTSTGAELNLLDGASAGTVVNSKAVVYGASGEVNATTLQIAGTSITSTATELNLLDGITSVLDEDDMSSDSDTSLATQQSIKAYVDGRLGMTFDSTAKTSGFTAAVNTTYMIDTSSGSFTATLPATPSIGSEVGFMDVTSSFDSNPLTLGRNSLKVFNAAADGTLDIKGYAGVLVYTGTTYGWMPRT